MLHVLITRSCSDILNVYAFCNLHDVSWGTKGSDKADALPDVSSSGEGEKGTVVETTKTADDLEASFQVSVKKALTPMKYEEHNESPTAEDENK